MSIDDLVFLREGEERRGLLFHVKRSEALEGGNGAAAVLVALLHLKRRKRNFSDKA